MLVFSFAPIFRLFSGKFAAQRNIQIFRIMSAGRVLAGDSATFSFPSFTNTGANVAPTGPLIRLRSAMGEYM